MFIEVVDALRCVEPHEDSWLVLASQLMVGRTVIEGTLGCPVCRRSYPIANGVAYFGGSPAERAASVGREALPPPTPTEDGAMRLAALLDLSSPGGLVVLAGEWAAYADAILDLVPVRLLLLDPAATTAMSEDWLAPDGSVSVVRTSGGAVPLAAGSARAIAFGDGLDDARLAGAARALAPGARLVAPASAALPAGVRELARDDELWVGERERGATSGAPVALRRARRE